MQLGKLEACKDRISELLKDFQARFNDLHQLKSCFVFLLNPFTINVVNDGFQLPKNIVMGTSAAEMEMLELQEDQSLALIHNSQSVMDSGSLCQKQPTLNFRKPIIGLYSFSVPPIGVKLYILQ